MIMNRSYIERRVLVVDSFARQNRKDDIRYPQHQNMTKEVNKKDEKRRNPFNYCREKSNE